MSGRITDHVRPGLQTEGHSLHLRYMYSVDSAEICRGHFLRIEYPPLALKIFLPVSATCEPSPGILADGATEKPRQRYQSGLKAEAYKKISLGDGTCVRRQSGRQAGQMALDGTCQKARAGLVS